MRASLCIFCSHGTVSKRRAAQKRRRAIGVIGQQFLRQRTADARASALRTRSRGAFTWLTHSRRALQSTPRGAAQQAIAHPCTMHEPPPRTRAYYKAEPQLCKGTPSESR